ncbi:hypothetical protein A3K86_16750 [Photobacterium jeanii]|uniref:Uncharacterized protein n=1 Tax=Photobacterium jeanii TaxID=858640 RepID=A0A178K7M7_9GAMM|nr:hypothetical protein A3K86_16750 [Photobacterium jeanii]PST90300.1 hypothetical protein C9I91_06530 [Photobacterium jeanii]
MIEKLADVFEIALFKSGSDLLFLEFGIRFEVRFISIGLLAIVYFVNYIFLCRKLISIGDRGLYDSENRR